MVIWHQLHPQPALWLLPAPQLQAGVAHLAKLRLKWLQQEKYLSGATVGAGVTSASMLLARVQLRVDSCRGMDFVGSAG